MTTDTLKQAARALRTYAYVQKGGRSLIPAAEDAHELAAALEAMVERPPVAWRWKRPNGVWDYATAQADDDGTVALDAKWEPLYAAPISTPEHDAQVRNAALRKMVDTMFTSGNAIPVERITITRKQFEEALKSTGGAA